MIRSMTGFGRAEAVKEDYRVTVELKSVNHRYLDLNIKMPSRIGYLENEVRKVLKEKLSRGKVDVYISYEEDADRNYTVVYHREIARMYYENIAQMAQDFGLDNDLRISHLSRFPDVLEIVEESRDADVVWDRLKEPLAQALERFIESRETEGEKLKTDLLDKLKSMTSHVDFIEERSPEILSEYKARLMEKVSELLEKSAIDENRIAAEVTIYADKICVDEEIVRLKSHIHEMESILNKGGEVGRKLDFLAQEMNREANTTLSKSTDVRLADTGIELKTLIEKIREQIQNLE